MKTFKLSIFKGHELKQEKEVTVNSQEEYNKMNDLQKEYLEHLTNTRNDFYNRGFMKQAQRVQTNMDEFTSNI